MSISTDAYIYTSGMTYLNLYSDREGILSVVYKPVRLIGYKEVRQHHF